MADDKTPAPATLSTRVNVGNVFTFSNGSATKITTTGDATTNTQILVSTPPRGPRVNAIDLGKLLGSKDAGNLASAGLSGIERGVTGAAATAAKTINKANDVAVIVQHATQGNGAELVTETAGMAAGAGGLATGALLGGKTFAAASTLFPPAVPFATGAGVVIGGAVGVFEGTALGKYLGKFLTGGDTPDKLGAPLTLPNNTPLEPTVIGADGNKYALVNVDGKYTWFAMLDNKNLASPNQFVEVVSGAKVAELTNGYLSAPETGFTQQVRELSAMLDIAYQNESSIGTPIDPRAGLRQDEINYQNSLAPNGKAWGTPTAIGSATETLSKGADSGYYTKTIEGKAGDGAYRIVQTIDSKTGAVLEEKSYQRSFQDAPDSFKLTGVSNYETGEGRTLNRDTGQMERTSVPKSKQAHRLNKIATTRQTQAVVTRSTDQTKPVTTQPLNARARRQVKSLVHLVRI